MIKVLYFGIAQEISGKATEEISALNTSDLYARILEQHPGLRSVMFRLALNGSLLKNETDLSSGDKIAVLPPFAGG